MATLGFNTLHAQSDEELLAQAFLKDVDKLPRKVYIVADVGSTLILDSKEGVQKMFCDQWQLCDTTLANEFVMTQVYRSDTANISWEKESNSWKRTAAALVAPKFNNLVFIKEREKAYRLLAKGKHVLEITKPIYNSSRSYALVSRTYYTYMGVFGFASSDHYILLKKVNGVWEEVGAYCYVLS